jgi:hypothetical protein
MNYTQPAFLPARCGREALKTERLTALIREHGVADEHRRNMGSGMKGEVMS